MIQKESYKLIFPPIFPKTDPGKTVQNMEVILERFQLENVSCSWNDPLQNFIQNQVTLYSLCELIEYSNSFAIKRFE